MADRLYDVPRRPFGGLRFQRAALRFLARPIVASAMLRTVIWIRVGDRYPALKAERDQFLALDGEAIVGVVQLSRTGRRPLAGDGP